MKYFDLKNLKSIVKLNLELSMVQSINLNGILGPYNINVKNFLQEYQSAISMHIPSYEGIFLKVELVFLRDGSYVVFYKGVGLSTLISGFLRWKKSRDLDCTVFTVQDLYFISKCYDLLAKDFAKLGEFTLNGIYCYRFFNVLGTVSNFNNIVLKNETK